MILQEIKKLKINTFLIGVQKAGTSTFWNWISQHPDVYGPEVMKDFHFFTRPEWREKGEEYLHSFYKDYKGEKIVLHGGVNYYFDPEFINHVSEYQPNGKYIIILRDPVERAWSAFQYFTKLGQENRTFDQAIEDELLNKNLPEDRHMYAYLDHGLYAKYLTILLSQIPREALLILQYENLFKEPQKFLKLTFGFLGIDPDYPIDIMIKKNTTGQVRFAWLNEMLFSKQGVIGQIKKNIPLQKLLPLRWRIRIGNLVRDMNIYQGSRKPRLPENFRVMMKEYFNDDIKDILWLIKEKNDRIQ